jgi:predicted Rossmann fold flavoprotein
MTRRRVIVVGAGAAGLMAAGQAAEMGAEVWLLEKMALPGRKLRITGKGRCNVTNMVPLSDFIARFGPNGRFLRQAFNRFFSADLVAFLQDLGVATVTERGGRVFPASGQAQDLVDALVHWVNGLGVHLVTRVSVERLLVDNHRVYGVQVHSSSARSGEPGSERSAGVREYCGDAVILATGGASYPATGSTGDGYRMAETVGHAIVPIRPALVPLETAGDIAPRLQGLSLRNVMVRLEADEERISEALGEMLFTHFGVSGPVILGMSKQAVDALQSGRQVWLSIDLKPALDQQRLDARLLRDLDTYGRRQFSTLLKELLPQKLIPLCVDQTRILPDKPASQITAEERQRLRVWLKDLRLQVTGHRTFDEAIVTAGGIDLREVDPRTMASQLVAGLFLAGELLDLDADTGGYNLQAAFSTGWLAGRSAAD